VELAERLSLPIIGPHKDDQFLLESLDEYGEMLGLPHSGNIQTGQWLSDGDTIHIGQQRLAVVHCPGHTPGHVIFYHEASKFAVMGDVLFKGSIGRTDFPRGNHADLIHSITQKCLPLGDDIRFIPGHGEMSTFGEERLHNPHLQSPL
ncbi:MAG: MBL fold metallo-hydrolase, partial [Arenicellales bacterium]